MNIYIYGDIKHSVDKKCKKLYKKGFFDTSWRNESKIIMASGLTNIYKFLDD